MRRAGWTALGRLALATTNARCGPEVRTLLVPADWAGRGTALVAVQSGGGGRLSAFRTEEPLFLDAEPGDALTLLEYDEVHVAPPVTLGEVGALPGSGCRLGEEHPPRRAFTTRVSDRGLADPAWTRLEPAALPAFVRDFELDLGRACQSPCPEWVVRPFVLPGSSSNPAWGAWLAHADEAVFGTYDEATYAVSPEAEVRPIERVPRLRVTSANLAANDELWLGGHGVVHHATFDGDRLSLEPRLERTDATPFAFISASISSTGRGLVGLTDRGELLVHDGRAFTEPGSGLSPFDDGGAQFSRRGGIARLGPDEAVVVWGQDRVVLRLRDGDLLDETPTELAEAGGAVAVVEGLGTVFGTSTTGTIYLHEGEAWVRLADPLGVQPRRIQALSDGFIVGASRGLLRQYLVGHGFCPEQVIFSTDIREIVKASERRLIVVGNRSGSHGGQAIGAVIERKSSD